MIGGAGVGIACQNTPQVHPCRLFLDVLSRKVLAGNTHPSFSLTVVHLSETIAERVSTKPRMYSTLLQDRTRQDAEARATQDVFKRILK